MRDIVEKVVVPLALVLAIVGVSLAWFGSAKNSQLLTQAREVQNELNGLQFRRTVYVQLAQSLLAYSQMQPNIDAVLIPMGLKAAPNQQAGAAQARQPQGQPVQAQPAQLPQTQPARPATTR
jgi:hypothetical protein